MIIVRFPVEIQDEKFGNVPWDWGNPGFLGSVLGNNPRDLGERVGKLGRAAWEFWV